MSALPSPEASRIPTKQPRLEFRWVCRHLGQAALTHLKRLHGIDPARKGNPKDWTACLLVFARGSKGDLQLAAVVPSDEPEEFTLAACDTIDGVAYGQLGCSPGAFFEGDNFTDSEILRLLLPHLRRGRVE